MTEPRIVNGVNVGQMFDTKNAITKHQASRNSTFAQAIVGSTAVITGRRSKISMAQDRKTRRVRLPSSWTMASQQSCLAQMKEQTP